MQVTCNMRTNHCKQNIINLLQNKHLLTMSEIQKNISTTDFSTVFRNVEQLLCENKIKRVIIDAKNIAYELMGDHHDHFVCDDCGDIDTIHIDRIAIEKQQRSLVIKVNDITVRGLCGDCQTKKQ